MTPWYNYILIKCCSLLLLSNYICNYIVIQTQRSSAKSVSWSWYCESLSVCLCMPEQTQAAEIDGGERSLYLRSFTSATSLHSPVPQRDKPSDRSLHLFSLLFFIFQQVFNTYISQAASWGLKNENTTSSRLPLF